MQYFLPILAFSIPAIGMVAGLACSFLISIFLLTVLLYCRFGFKNRVKKDFGQYCNKSSIIALIATYKLESAFAGWCLLSCFAATNMLTSLILYCQVFLVIYLGLVLIANIQNLTTLAKVERALIWGVYTAIILFFIEYNFNGIISTSFRAIFQSYTRQYFTLYMLDRGCALLAITAWLVIGIFTTQKKYIIAILLYSLVLYLLSLSDSFASFVAFFISGLVFLVVRITTIWLLKPISICLIIASLLMPIVAYNIAPAELSNQYSNILPDSAKHRLFIWHFVADKILEHPILGIGFGASKTAEIKDNEMVNYQHHRWSPLPLHPHNNILQILFETGLIGLLLFLSIVYKLLKNINLLAIKRPTFGLIAYACFINYYIIGMISFSVWQVWWVCVGVWAIVMMKWVVSVHNPLQ